MAESLQFSATIDDSQIQQKLNALPAAAAKSAEKVGESIQKGFDAGIRKGTSGASDVKSRFAKFAAGSSATDAQRAADKKENEKAQLHLDELKDKFAKKEERRISALQKKEETEAKRMDEARARSRAQLRSMAEKEADADRNSFSDRKAGMRGAAKYGLGIGAAIVGAALQEGNFRNQIQIENGGLNYGDQQRVRAMQLQQSGTISNAGRISLQQSGTNEAQQELEKMRSPQKVSIFDIMDNLKEVANFQQDVAHDLLGIGKGRSFKTQRDQEDEAAAQKANRLENFSAANVVAAKQRQQKLDEITVGGPKKSLEELDKWTAGLRASQKQLEKQGLNNPQIAKDYQQFEATIQSIKPLRDHYAQIMEATANAALGNASPSIRIAQLNKLTGQYQKRRASGNLEDRFEMDGKLASLEIQTKQAENEQFFGQVNSGLMGAGGRRSLYRQHRSEQNEIDRTHRMRGESWVDRKGVFHSGSGRGRDARAFRNETTNPVRGIQAEQDRRGTEIAGLIQQVITAVNGINIPHLKGQ